MCKCVCVCMSMCVRCVTYSSGGMRVHCNYPQPLSDQASELGSAGAICRELASHSDVRATAAMAPPKEVKEGPRRHQRGVGRTQI
jgi:hypothetical protein